MPFISQDNTGTVENANAYGTLDDFHNYFTDRGVESSDYDDENIEAALIQAADYIDFTFSFKFFKVSELQTTEWPRGKIGIPVAVIKASFEYAKLVLDGTELFPSIDYDSSGQNVKSKKEKLGPIEESVTYKDDYTINTMRKYPKADKYLEAYIVSSNAVFKQRG